MSRLNGWTVELGKVTATDHTVSVAHGLPAAPTFILAQSSTGAVVNVAADATTLQLKSASAVTSTISYIAKVI